MQRGWSGQKRDGPGTVMVNGGGWMVTEVGGQLKEQRSHLDAILVLLGWWIYKKNIEELIKVNSLFFPVLFTQLLNEVSKA